MSSLKPCTPLPPPNNNKKLQFPLLPGMNKSVQLPCFTPGSPLAHSIQEQHYTTCKKAKPISPKLTGSHNRLTNHLRIYLNIFFFIICVRFIITKPI